MHIHRLLWYLVDCGFGDDISNALFSKSSMIRQSLSISICKVPVHKCAGKVQDAAGNVLYSDLTSPEIFGVDSNNGQYTVPIPGTVPTCSIAA